MFDIAGHWGKCKSKSRAITAHVLKGLQLKSLTTPSVGRDLEPLELAHTTTGGKVQWSKHFGSFFKTLSIHLAHDPASPLPGQVKANLLTKTCTRMFMAAPSVTARTQKPLNVHRQVNGEQTVAQPRTDCWRAIQRDVCNLVAPSQTNYAE